MIRKNQIMIRSNQKIKTLFGTPWQKVGGGKRRAQNHKTFYAAQFLKILSKRHGFLQNNLRDFWFFIISHIWTFWICSSDQWKKCVVKFQKSKIWYVHFFRFSVPVVVVYDFFPISIRVWRQIGVENGPILIFEKNQKSLKTFCKNPLMK